MPCSIFLERVPKTTRNDEKGDHRASPRVAGAALGFNEMNDLRGNGFNPLGSGLGSGV